MVRRYDEEGFEHDLARVIAYGDPMRRFSWLTFQNIAAAFTAFCGGILLVYQIGGKAKEIDLRGDNEHARIIAVEAKLSDVDQKLNTQVVTRQEFIQLQEDVRDIKNFLFSGRNPR